LWRRIFAEKKVKKKIKKFKKSIEILEKIV